MSSSLLHSLKSQRWLQSHFNRYLLQNGLQVGPLFAINNTTTGVLEFSPYPNFACSVKFLPQESEPEIYILQVQDGMLPLHPRLAPFALRLTWNRKICDWKTVFWS